VSRWRELAPAKLNLGLAIEGRRTDGRHELRSLFVRLALADELSATAAPGGAGSAPGAGGPDLLEVEGPPEVPIDDNLVLKAATALRARRPDAPPLAFRLVKHVPTAAGLGGGSSDAAAALRLAARAWDLRLPAGDIRGLASQLGSDVPFFATGVDAAWVRGGGEVVEPIAWSTGRLGVLLVMPAFGMSTGRAFAVLDALRPAPPAAPGARAVPGARSRTWIEALAEVQPEHVLEIAAELRDANDLWPAAIAVRPELAVLRDAVEACLGRPALLSGSGPTLAALYPSGQAAEEAGRGPARSPDPALARVRALATSA
jgi:4-diphosphocytidyl-2-C-methyl-D-erythritol kinase